MPKGACVFFPDQQCSQNACPNMAFLRRCPLFRAAMRERASPAAPTRPAMVRPAAPRSWLYPAVVWLIVLATIFGTEYAVMLLLPWLLPSEPPRLLEATIDAVILIAVLAPVMWWTIVRPLREVSRLQREFLTNLFSRIETDRRGTAHELHDGVGQSLSLLVSGLRSAHESVTDPEAVARCEQLLHLARGALKEVKRLALGLRPSLLDDLGLAPALERLVADVRDNYPVDLALDVTDLADVRFSEAVETAVFRVVQEALANVVAHSGARTASVAVRRRGGELTVSIADDGCGFDPADRRTERAGHLGLVGMKERTTLLAGDFAIRSARGLGTRVTATIPVGS